MIAGYIRVRITSAQPEYTLDMLSSHMQIRDVTQTSDLSLECSIPKWKLQEFRETMDHSGASWEPLGVYGFPRLWKQAWRAPVLVWFLIILLAASFWIPSRIFFIRVNGNDIVTDQEILQAASHVGLYFGINRRALRSEQIKNQLLSSIPALSWVGVNTQGCVATISVQERKLEPEQSEDTPGHIVAAQDAVITSFTATRGQALCQNGQAVHAGDILISGYLDLGICTRIEQAEGEVYGLTKRDICAVVPEKTHFRQTPEHEISRHSIIIGKKRINLYSDSGILYPTCGKMTEVKTLTLPGGWELPVQLVTERYTQSAIVTTTRSEEQAEKILLDFTRTYIQQHLVAGEILEQDIVCFHKDGTCRLQGAFACHEMIGKRSSAVFIEGDTNDDGKNG